METKTVKIPNISCGHCVANIRRELVELEGVASVEGSASDRTVTVRWNAPATWERIAATLDEIGYPAAA
ncbi:MAG: heavy-metal-associated domain-containing protein [bacterium]